MKRGFLAAILVVGALLFGSPQLASADIASGQKAILIQPNNNGDFATSDFNASVSKAVSDGVNYVYLVIPVHQANTGSTSIYASYNTPSDQSLAAATSYIHSKGAKVAFSMHDDSDDGQWRANINPGDRTSWFNSYSAQLQHYGTLAQQTGADEFVLGTEMANMTMPSVNSTNTSNWQAMIAKVRSVYGGKLTYSAQHDGYLGEVNTIGFWPQLDYIGVSAYYSMGYDSSVSAQMQHWASVDSSYLSGVSSRYGKQILFTEVGYQSKQGALNDPGAAYGIGGGVDLTAQANAYQALLQYWDAKNYFAGAAFWDWKVNPNAGGTNDNDYTPQNKPAEQIMKQWFTKTGSTTGGGTTPSQPTNPAPTAYNATQTSSTTIATGSTNAMNYTVTANQTLTNALVDLEIYNSAGQQVYQKALEGQTVTPAGLSFSVSWTPPATGTYTVKLGVFTANWAQNLYWNDKVATVTVNAPATTPTPPVITPTPPVTTPPTTTPTPPATTPTVANLSIWWPGNGVNVSGVQPFKAVIDGQDLSKYAMYWQVDGGTLNQMGNSSDGGAHKESQVDLSSWTWQSSGKYVVNFVAKDQSGNVIATKSVTISVSH